MKSVFSNNRAKRVLTRREVWSKVVPIEFLTFFNGKREKCLKKVNSEVV